ncbi:MAG: hypothetical protein QW728_04705 [Thermoplasmata archaeon]
MCKTNMLGILMQEELATDSKTPSSSPDESTLLPSSSSSSSSTSSSITITTTSSPPISSPTSSSPASQNDSAMSVAVQPLPGVFLRAILLITVALLMGGVSATIGLWNLSQTFYHGQNTSSEELSSGLTAMCSLGSISIMIYIVAQFQLVIGASLIAFYRNENRTGMFSWIILSLAVANYLVNIFRFIYLASVYYSPNGADSLRGQDILPVFILGGLSSTLTGLAWGFTSWATWKKLSSLMGSGIYILSGILGCPMTYYSISTILNNNIPAFLMYGFWIDYFGGGIGAGITYYLLTRAKNKLSVPELATPQ